MVLSNEVQIRRSCAYKPLRKPSVPISKSSNRATFSEELVHGFENKILLLDEDCFKSAGDAIKKEILSSLNEGTLSTSTCLQLFLDTAWKDRNRTPIIAEIFHNIAQEHDDESATGLTALLEKSCNDLLNILTCLGKPEVNNIHIVTLLSNLYRLETLPEEHREGVESYLVDIAKAFWPYFVPQKREVWDNELVSDAICDVFHTVGKVLEKKCPVNMERTFNKITTMLFSANIISEYTRLRLLEVKENRATGWTMPDSARDYYRAAFLKLPRNRHNSYARPVSPSSPSSSVDDVFISSTENSPPTTPTTETKREFLKHDKYEVTVCGNWTSTVSDKPHHPFVIRIKPKPLPEQNNNITSVTNNSTASIGSNPSGKHEKFQNISEQQCTDHSKMGKVSTPNIKGFQDQICGFGTPNGSDNSNPQAGKDFQEGRKSYENSSESRRPYSPNYKQKENHVQAPPSTSCSDSLPHHMAANPNNDTTSLTKSSNIPDECNQTEMLSTFNNMESSTLTSEGKSPHNVGTFSRDSSFSQGFSSPDSSSSPSFTESPFNRQNSFGNESPSIRQRLSSTGEMSHQRRSPFNRNGGLHRSHSESSTGESSYSRHGQSPNGCDSTGFGHPDGSRVSSWTPNYQRQTSYNRWRSNLEFPVQEVLGGEDIVTSSRLYLLSFATTPAALERPADLTLTPEVEAEKEWLKCLILDEPNTVLDRFGQ